MSLGRLVPWISWDEWETVGKCLYDDRYLDKGLEIVSAWRIRGRVPVGVDATALLRETQQADGTGTVSDALLRLQYSLALVRFVNGVADSAQKGRVASSVAHLAHQADIPRILVDIRHESTHNDLPSLSVLRVAAKQALEWLRTKYWVAQRAYIAESEARVRETVQLYIESHVRAASRGIPRGEDMTDEERRAQADDVRKGKKHRQILFTELRTSVPRGAEKLVADSMMTCSSFEYPEQVLRKAFSSVLSHLLGEWPDLHCMLVRICLDQQMKSSDDIMCTMWMRVSLDAMAPESIGAVMLGFMRAQGPLLRQRHIEAFVEARHDDALQNTLMRLRDTFDSIAADRSLTPSCQQELEAFSAAFFTMPTTPDLLDAMKQINEPKVSVKLSGWTRVDGWTPCAIGMMPSPDVSLNGTMPDMHLDVDVHDTLATPLKTDAIWCPKIEHHEVSSPQETIESDSSPWASDRQPPQDSGLGSCLPPPGISFNTIT